MFNTRLYMSVLAASVFVAGATTAASAQAAAVSREGTTAVEVRNPTPAELKALVDATASTSEDDTDLKVVQHKNGMYSVDLKGKFQSLAVAKKNSDGTVSVKCVDNEQDKAAFLHANKAKATTKSAERK